MIKSINEREQKQIEIDLTGPDGNAFALMAYAGRFAKQLGLDKEAIIKDMMSSDYEHLLQVFDKHFGSFVTLYR
jgi:hypothetical protein